jgi:hypothetical protein
MIGNFECGIKIRRDTNPWISFGAHLDFLHLHIDIHFLWWVIVIGNVVDPIYCGHCNTELPDEYTDCPCDKSEIVSVTTDRERPYFEKSLSALRNLEAPLFAEYMQQIGAWAEAYDREAVVISGDELENLYDDQFCEVKIYRRE